MGFLKNLIQGPGSSEQGPRSINSEQDKGEQGRGLPPLQLPKKTAKELETKYNKRVESKPQPSIFKGGLVRGEHFEKAVLDAYAKETGEPLWRVKEKKQKVLSEVLGEGGYGKDWYNAEKIRQNIHSNSRSISQIPSWKAKNAQRSNRVLKRIPGIDKKAA